MYAFAFVGRTVGSGRRGSACRRGECGTGVVNRVTREGRVLGEAERVTPYQGLQALTVNGAYEYFEEASKGTLEAGKRADLVVLDRNPIKADPMSIKDIRVIETIKDGRRVYQAMR